MLIYVASSTIMTARGKTALRWAVFSSCHRHRDHHSAASVVNRARARTARLLPAFRVCFRSCSQAPRDRSCSPGIGVCSSPSRSASAQASGSDAHPEISSSSALCISRYFLVIARFALVFGKVAASRLDGFRPSSLGWFVAASLRSRSGDVPSYSSRILGAAGRAAPRDA
jgi:hypothetical protein